MDIPQVVLDKCLPNPLLSVVSLLGYPPPNITLDAPDTLKEGILSADPSHFDGSDVSTITLAVSSLAVPPVQFLETLRQTIALHTGSRYRSFKYTSDSKQILLPFWVSALWMELHTVAHAQTNWRKAISWIEGLPNASDWVAALVRIPWKYTLPRALGGSIGIQFLSAFCSSSWLASLHVDQMMAVLDQRVLEDSSGTRIVGTLWSDMLQTLFRHRQDEYSSSSSAQYHRQLGEQIRAGHVHHIATIVSVYFIPNQPALLPNRALDLRGNHWVAVVVDLNNGVACYGDPAGGEAPSELWEMLKWWLAQHGWGGEMKTGILPTPTQADSYSCSTLAFTSLISHFYPSIPLISSSPDGVPGRLQALDIISSAIQKLVTAESPPSAATPLFPASDLQVKPAPTVKPAATVTKGEPAPAESGKRFLKRWPGYTLDEQIGVIFNKVIPGVRKHDISDGPGTSAKRAKRPKRGQASSSHEASVVDQWGDQEDGFGGGDTEPEIGEESDEIETSNPSFLVDCAEAKGRDMQKGGRPTSSILDQLTVRCYKVWNPETLLWRCAGNGCTYTFGVRSTDRVFRHARVCTKLPPSTMEQVRTKSAQRAPSATLEKAQEEIANGGKGKAVMKGQIDGGPSNPNVEIPKGSQDFFKRAKELGKAQRHKQLMLAITELFCVSGLPLSLAASSTWKKVLAYADPTYKAPSRSALSDQCIPAEADRIYMKTVEVLKASNDLTLSLDGGTSRGGESFWTLHISTPDGQVHLMQVREATAESHTGDWLRDFALETINAIGPPRFSSMVSDSTGNTLLGRTKVGRAVPTIIPIADCVHHLSNTIGDIVKLPFFHRTLSIMRAVITKIHKSHLGTAEFRAARNIIPGAPSRGLEAVGKTRFGTIIYSARSLQRNLPIIKEIVKRGKFNMGTYAQYFDSRTNLTTLEFEFYLAQLVRIGTPAIQAMTCLESNTATAADVYVFFHAFLALTLETLEDKGMAFPAEQRTEIRAILEWRFNQLFGSGNLSSDVYVSAAYLIPAHFTTALFKHMPAPEGNAEYAGIPNLDTFKTVASFLLKIAENEINHGHKTEFTKWQNRASAFVPRLLNELKAYSRQHYPFNSPYDEELGPLLWWGALRHNELSQILPLLAIKILSIRVNSMEEERTGSVFSWLSPPLRARISVDTMAAITRVRRHYQEESKPHSHSLKRPKISFFEFRHRFMDDAKGETGEASSDAGRAGPDGTFSDVVVNGEDADGLNDDEDWLEPDVVTPPSAAGFIEGSPVVWDCTHITAALSWNEPPKDKDSESSSMSLISEVAPDGEDNDFTPKFGF